MKIKHFGNRNLTADVGSWDWYDFDFAERWLCDRTKTYYQ